MAEHRSYSEKEASPVPKQAIGEPESGKADIRSRRGEIVFGAVDSFGLSAEIAAALSQDDFQALVPVVQAELQTPFQPALVGHTLNFHYRSAKSTKSILFAVSRKVDRLTLTLTADYREMKGGLFAGIVGGFGAGLGLGLGALLGEAIWHSFSTAVPISLAGAALSYPLARLIFRGLVENDKKKFTRLFARLRDRIAEWATGAEQKR